MFLNAPAKPGGGGGGGGTVEQKKPEVISLISDSKKAYNMNIMISKFKKYSNDQMRVAVETMDPDILTVDACSTLLPFCPEKEEISAASTYEGEISGLDPASQFIVAVHKIPRLQLRFKNSIFKGDFDDKLDAMAKDVEVFRNGCVTLTSNENFRKFLKIALNIGNTLNAGTARGGAYGFKLSSLVAFMNTKGNKPNMTLLSYIVQQVYSQKPEWLDFTSEFDKLNDVSKLNIDNLVKDISGLKTQVQNLKGTIDLASKSNPADSGYVNCFQPFYESAWPKVSACETKANETKTLYVQTAKFLGEDDESLKKKTSEEFFAIFVNINNSIKKTVKDEEERKKKEARGKK